MTTDDDTLTRSDVAKRLDVSVSTVRRMAERGELPCTVDEHGVHHFRGADVERLERQRRGEPEQSDPELPAPSSIDENAAAVFASFDEGLSCVEVVKRLKLKPEIVAAYHDQWLALRMRSNDVPDGATRQSATEERLALAESLLQDINESQLADMRLDIERLGARGQVPRTPCCGQAAVLAVHCPACGGQCWVGS